MHTGEGDIDRLGDIVTWNGKERTEAFPGNCGRLQGSADGLLTPGKLTNADKFDIWSTDICRFGANFWSFKTFSSFTLEN